MVKELNLMNISSLNISMNAMACLVEPINCESRELSAVESRGESCGLRVDIRRSAREPESLLVVRSHNTTQSL